jgi:hypothetical protein
MIRSLMVTVLCVVGLSCAAAPKPRAATASVPTTQPTKYLVIVKVVSRDKTVTISSGPKGLVYSLALNDGKVLLANASGEEFAKLHPDLYRFIRQYIAVKNDEAFMWDGADESSRAMPQASDAVTADKFTAEGIGLDAAIR